MGIGWVLGVVAVGVLHLVCLTQFAQGNVVRLGNALQASTSGVDIPGVIFLMNDVILQEGVVFAFSAFFRSSKPIRIQIWRPVNPDIDQEPEASRPFRLLFETRIIPSVIHRREDMYIESKLVQRCVRVNQGDRLGVYLEEAPGAVAYFFDSTKPDALGHNVGNNQKLKVNDTVGFDILKFPYDFSLSAYIFTNLTNFMATPNGCPMNVLIPDHANPTLPPTTAPTIAPGVQGQPGPQGPRGIDGGIGQVGRLGPAGNFGPQGPAGPAGVGVGAVGPDGPTGPAGPAGVAGSRGVVGPKGFVGDRGLAGPPGPPGAAGRKGNTTAGEPQAVVARTVNPTLLLIILIWLIVCTAIVVIIVIVILCIRRKERQYEHKRLPSGSDFKPSWMEAFSGDEDDSRYMTQDTRRTSLETAIVPENIPSYSFDNAVLSIREDDQNKV